MSKNRLFKNENTLESEEVEYVFEERPSINGCEDCELNLLEGCLLAHCSPYDRRDHKNGIFKIKN